MEFCDSSGLGALIAAHNHAQAAGADIALAAVPATTLRILRIVGLDQVFPVHSDSDSADRARPAGPRTRMAGIGGAGAGGEPPHDPGPRATDRTAPGRRRDR